MLDFHERRLRETVGIDLMRSLDGRRSSCIRFMQAGSEVAKLPTQAVEARAHFDAFVEEEHDRLFKALYSSLGAARTPRISHKTRS